MLTIHSISSPADTRELFRKFDPEVTTWLVSDLRSKLDLTRGLLERKPFLPAEGVLRASELWRLLLKRLRPDLEVASREFVSAIFSQSLAQSGEDWLRSPGAASTAYDYLTQLIPILSHPAGAEMMEEWFKEHPASEVRWGRWFALSNKLWAEFLEMGLLAPTWVSGVLTNEISLGEVWLRPLVVQLGAELDQVESDLLSQISEKVDVVVLRPDPSWAGEAGPALAAYEVFKRKGAPKIVNASARDVASSQAPVYRKSTTMIGEVKDAVAQARAWLNTELKGEKASKIAIVAADIERYWPALSSYLEVEGLPFQKDRVRRLHTFPEIARWLAILRLRAGSYKEADVELALFDAHDRQTPVLSFDRFQTLYSAIYDRSDLGRAPEVASRFTIDIERATSLDRDDFVAWSLKQLPANSNFERVQSLYKRLFADCPERLTLSPDRWLNYLEKLAAKVESRLEDGDSDGVACLNLSSAESSPATHMIILGLNEASLKPSGGTSISMADMMSLAAQFGFYLPGAERACLEFEARWVIGDHSRKLILSVPETDFAGSSLAPSWLWIKGARELGTHEDLNLPQATRWDEIQRSHLAKIVETRAWETPHAERFEESLLQDLGEMELPPWSETALASQWANRLSASSIEDYLDCPFIFAAKRLFALSDSPELDLEVDPSRRGSLMHKVFELLTVEPVRFDYSDDELNALLERARVDSKLELADDRLWTALRARHLDLARRFLASEKAGRQAFPETKTVHREAEIKGFMNPANGELSSTQNSPDDFQFIGRVDRIDADEKGNLLIYDYKSSPAGAKQFGSWIKNNQLQLLLYSMAVEKGLAAMGPKPVAGALYYVAKTFDRDQGFKVKDVAQGLFETEGSRKRNRLGSAEKEVLFTEAQALAAKAAQGIRAAQFAPAPRTLDLCKDCRWSALCRAPHLL